MRRIIVGFFALIGLFFFGMIVLLVAALIFAAPGEKKLAQSNVLMLDLTQSLPETAPDGGVERVLLGEQRNFRDVLDALERAGDDSRIKGLVARLGAGETGTAQIQELRDAIAAFRAKGKFTFGYADGFGELGTGTRAYYLGSAFDELWLQPFGEVGLVGLRVETPFFRGMLDKLGIQPRFDHRSEYKTAMNVLTETKMTPPHREETDALLHSVFEQMVRGIAEGRRLEAGQVRKLIDQGPFSTQEALDAHLVDHIGYREDAIAAARSRAGENAQLVSLSRYLDRAGRPHQSGPTIAVILGRGLIARGNNSSNPLSGTAVLGADALTHAFRMAAEDKSVRAILFRIDSPGGSAAASEAIWRETLRAKEAGKPVIVSMSNVAGSGGYYIAVAADKIVAEPATLTGSIGVVGGKVLIGGLSSTLGVTWDGAQVGKQADMYSVISDFTPAEHQRFEHMLDDVYAGFKQRVAEGRKLSADAVEEVAKGRVWTGEDAKARGLVDELGGFDKALSLAKQAAGIAPEQDVTLKWFPPPANTPAAILARLTGRDTGDDEDEQSSAARLGADRLFGTDRLLAAWRPLLRYLDLAAAPPGALTMPPIELR
jgi:protease IV